MKFNKKRILANMLSTAVLFSTIFSVPINGQEGGEPKAVASEKTYRAMVGFQTDKYDYRSGYERVEVDQVYNEWRGQQGKNIPDQNGVNIYRNGNGPRVSKRDGLKDPERVEPCADAVAVDTTVNGDGEYTVSIKNLNLVNEDERYFNMLYIATDIVKSSDNRNITAKASSVKIGGEEIAKDVVLPVRGDVADGDYYWFMLADAYSASDNTDTALLYPGDQNGTTALKVPEGAFDIEITFTMEGMDEKSVVEETENPVVEETQNPVGEETDEENRAYLMFTDKDWKWMNFDTKVSGGVGQDALIQGNATYTVSIRKEDFEYSGNSESSGNAENPANGALVFAVNIKGICRTKKFDASKMAISYVSVKCDGKEIKTDLSKMYEGDIEGKGDYRLEIRNEYGYGDGDFATKDEFDETNPDFTFKESLSVTFTVTGIREGETPEDAFQKEDNDGTVKSVVEAGGLREERLQQEDTDPAKTPAITNEPDFANTTEAPLYPPAGDMTSSPETTSKVSYVVVPTLLPKAKVSASPIVTTTRIPVTKAPASPTASAKATASPAVKKPYGDKLKLNNEIKLNKTKSYVKKGYVKESTLFPKKKTVKVKYSISCKRKSAGDKYKVTYKVKYKYLNDPKISGKKMAYDDWVWGWYQPEAVYTIFDYQTGKSIEKKNNLGVKVKNGNWKYSYYPKQHFKCTDTLIKLLKEDNYDPDKISWVRNGKTVSYQFTVTYPKDCKDVVVGIGFYNTPDSPLKKTVEANYWKGKEVYGKTLYYKKGKKTMSYMRLNQ